MPLACQTESMPGRAELWCLRLGVIPYAQALELQGALSTARQEGRIPDVLVVLEHPPVFTKGRRSEARELGMGEDWYRMQGIEVCETDRGGRVTYHGIGQLVAYPIVDLAGLRSDGRPDVHEFVRSLERVTIETLADHGVPAQVFSGLTGVWTEGSPPVGEQTDARKIGSIGIHVTRGVTTHGLAVNVNNDLQPFEWIIPCGIDAVRMTSVGRELGQEQDLEAFAATLIGRFGEVLAREPRHVEVADIAARGEGIEPLLEGSSLWAVR